MSVPQKLQKVKKALRRRIFGYLKLKKRKLLGSNSMPFLQLHLTEHCNLNCKGCAHFSPIAEEQFLDVHTLEAMYQKLPQPLEQWFSRLELMGGEPLLHPQVGEILALSRRYFPHMDIRLVTNGLLLDRMPEEFFHICAKQQIMVYLSMYPVRLDYEALYRKLDRYGVAHSRYGEFDRSKTFINYRLDPKGYSDPKKSYRNCRLGGRCLQLKDDRLYPCFLSAYAEHLNHRFHTGFLWEDGDTLSLDRPISQEAFLRFINNPVPFCRYCPTAQLTESEWDFSQKDAGEWLV